MSALLTVEDISISFGNNRVLESVSFELSEGEVLGCIGPNGAGKTVMLNIITGMQKPDGGRFIFMGRDITRLNVADRARIGVGRTFQIPRAFANMTAYENVLVGAVFGGGQSERAAGRKACDILSVIGLSSKTSDFAGKLSLLDRKRLEIGVALASDPKALLLDEVAGGLTESEVTEILRIVGWIKSSGVGVVWIEHVLQTMLHGTDRVMLLSDGRNMLCGSPSEVMASREVEDAYLGVDRGTPRRKRRRFGTEFAERNGNRDE
ncbi:MAG: ATP-binding cassette domain-containing protein [Clostridiales Family XIII bacterium]|nr:ATP-binding cassette domain-containing protein [Clostridiales Family XIII bacterium]